MLGVVVVCGGVGGRETLWWCTWIEILPCSLMLVPSPVNHNHAAQARIQHANDLDDVVEEEAWLLCCVVLCVALSL